MVEPTIARYPLSYQHSIKDQKQMLTDEDRLTLTAIAMRLEKNAPRAASTLFDIVRDIEAFERQTAFSVGVSRGHSSLADQIQDILAEKPRTFLELLQELGNLRETPVNPSSVRVQMSAVRERLLREGKRALVKNDRKQYVIIQGAEAQRLSERWKDSMQTPQKTGRLLREVRDWFREVYMEIPEKEDILVLQETDSPDHERACEWPFMFFPRFERDDIKSWIEIQFSEKFIARLSLARPPVAVEDWLTRKGLKTTEIGEFPRILYISADQ